MDDVDEENQSIEDLSYDASHQGCYIFRSAFNDKDQSSGQPRKKRKLNGSAPASLSPYVKTTLPLEKRKKFSQSTRSFENESDYQDHAEGKALSQLADYIQRESASNNSNRLRVALVMSGVDEGNYQTVLRGLQQLLEDDQAINVDSPQDLTLTNTRNVLIELKAQQCPNLQVALKNLVKLVIVQASNNIEAYQAFLTQRKKLLPLNYDLDLLDQFCHQSTNLQIVVSLSDVESFSNQVINELISTLNIWKDRLKLFLLFGIASTRELFEQRLSRSCLRLLDARHFHFAPSTDLHSKLIRQAQRGFDKRSNLSFDYTTLLAMNDVCQKQGNSTQSIKQMLKLIYMSHDLANPLAAFSHAEDLSNEEMHALAEAARRTHSFRNHCARLLQSKHKSYDQKIRALLNDDSELLQEVREHVDIGREAYSTSLEAVYLLADLHQALSTKSPSLRQSRIEVESLLLRSLPNLAECDIYIEICEKVRSLNPPQLSAALDLVDRGIKTSPDFKEYLSSVDQEPQHGNSVDKAAKRSNKRAIAKEPSVTELLGNDINGSNGRVIDEEVVLGFLEALVHDNSFDCSVMLLHESYIIPNRLLRLKQFFEPNPRVAIERALTSPGDYLGCGCCSVSSAESTDDSDPTSNGNSRNGTGTGSMPPAAVLFILLQEAPTIINLRDLYDAFESRLQETQIDGQRDDDSSSAAIMMLFYRSLAELKMLGLVKESAGTQQVKRKAKASKVAEKNADFVAKTSWAGL